MSSPLHPSTPASLHILVTGCAGFIGWKVTEFLLADGHTVECGPCYRQMEEMFADKV
jgi:NAD(P)-dependent dehydrogenase (short-subunit alcohol dehydrogenase family)